MVIGRRAGTTATRPPSLASTVVLANGGMNCETGSVSEIRPSSTSIITPTLTTALVIEAIRKMVSVRIGAFFSRSALPAASK